MSVQTLPSGSYCVRWQDDGGKWRSRTFPRGMKREADDFDREIKRAKARGELDLIDAGRELLGDYIEQSWWPWIEHTKEPKTIGVYRSATWRYIVPRLGHERLRAITPELIESFEAELIADGVGRHSIDKAMRVLSGVLQRAAKGRRIPHNPYRLIDRVKMPMREPRHALSPAQVEALRGARFRLGGRQDSELTQFDARGRIAISIMGYAGHRPQELPLLRWRHVGEQTLLTGAPKTRAYRSVDLLAPLKQDLAEWRMLCGRPDDDAFVIPGQRGQAQWSQASYHRWRADYFKPATDVLKLDVKITPYNLRHGFASLLLAAGLPISYVAEQMGHSVQTLSEHYAHVINEYRGRAAIDPAAEIATARAATASSAAIFLQRR